MSKLSIAKVQIYDTLGIRELEFEAGRYTEITGKNGEGKSSVLNAIKSVFEGGNDATLIRAGEEKSEIVLVLSDRTTIRKRTTGSTTAVTVEKDGVRQAKPQETINALRDLFSVNPVAFLNAKPDKQKDVLLESLPMVADVERVRTIIGDEDYELKGDHALFQIDAAYDSVFADRRDTNRAAKDKVSAINSLAETLPPEGEIDGVHPDDTEDGLQARITGLDDAWRAEQARIDTKLAGLRDERDAEVQGWRDQIAELQAKIAKRIEDFAEMNRLAGLQRQKKESDWREAVAGPQRALDLIRANRDAVARAANTRNIMSGMRAEADKLEADSERMSKALKALEAYKAEFLKDLPAGLTVRDGALYQGDVPFHRLNKATQVGVAIEVAKARAGELGVVCVDELENLDTEHREALIEQGAAAGLQFFVTRVSDEPLAITSH